MINDEQQIEEILTGCKAGNIKAQETLYRSFYGSMMNLCLRYTKNDADAMEALNTGFCKVYKNIRQFNRKQSSLYTWIRAIIINSCLDIIGVKQKALQTAELTVASSTEIEPEVISKLDVAHLLEIIRKLPAATQTVFNLFIVEGYSHKEIAALLKISEGTSKWHVSDARKKLQIMINEENNK